MEEEVCEAISQMEHNKALGPDGFPEEFCQKNWDVINVDLMALFTQLRMGDLPLFKLNFAVIALLPNKEDASRIEQYRPICLLNVVHNLAKTVNMWMIFFLEHDYSQGG
jgi:hypothetical protein